MALLSSTSRTAPTARFWYTPIKPDRLSPFVQLFSIESHLLALDALGAVWKYGEWLSPEGRQQVGWAQIETGRYELQSQ